MVPRMLALALAFGAIAMTTSGCGRRGSPVPVKAETVDQAARRSSADVVEERARLGQPGADGSTNTTPLHGETTPFPSDAPSQMQQSRPSGGFFLDFLL